MMKMKDVKHKVGDDIYIPTSLHLSRGSDNFQGGLCKIKKIEAQHDYIWVEVEEQPGHEHNYEMLLADQDKLKKEYGDRRGYANPDEDRPWIETGDSVTQTTFDRDGKPHTKSYTAKESEW